MAIKKGNLKRLVQTLAQNKRLENPLESITNHDHRAAFICALAALCVARKQYVAVGDPEDGHIVLPPIPILGGGTLDRRPTLGRGHTTGEHQYGMRKAGGHFAKAQILGNGMPWD